MPFNRLLRSEYQYVSAVRGHLLTGEQDKIIFKLCLPSEFGQVIRGPYVMMVGEHKPLQSLVPYLFDQGQCRDVAAWGMLTRVGMDFEKQGGVSPGRYDESQPFKKLIVVVLYQSQDEHDQ
jgi:hypothetical protein